jgi:hypothetical protein
MPSSTRLLLRLEGLFVLTVSAGLYATSGHSWLLFAALLLTPDLFMAGYGVGPRVGARLYNIGHTYVLPIGLGIAAHFWALPPAEAVALIWSAHIGMDRALGYGLKSPRNFHRTHLTGSVEIHPQERRSSLAPRQDSQSVLSHR